MNPRPWPREGFPELGDHRSRHGVAFSLTPLDHRCRFTLDPRYGPPNSMTGIRIAVVLPLVLVAGLLSYAPVEPEAAPFSVINIAGEVTQTSVILQSRLGTSDTPVANDIPGFEGWGYFEVARDSAFAKPLRTRWLRAAPENDYHLKIKVTGLTPGTRYHYRVHAGHDSRRTAVGPVGTFRTLPSSESTEPVTFVMLSCMHYERFYGLWNPQATRAEWTQPATGEERRLGYPGFEVLLRLEPDFVVSNGDNVYYSHPRDNPATTQEELRAKWHRQLAMPRMRRAMDRLPFYFLKDDHDYRFNDADTTAAERAPSHALGMATFREQVPVTDPEDPGAVTYRTHRVNQALQLWFLEGRDYRSPNQMPDGPEKTLWGATQKAWLQRTLVESDADFKILVSPTPMVGPDDAYKRDNHVNHDGFRHEGETFIAWLAEQGLTSSVFLLNGDRHWQYHSRHPLGLEEFSSGAFITQNARLGRDPGDPDSTDPEGRIRQLYSQPVPVGGMLHVRVDPASEGSHPSILFSYYDERGNLLYAVRRYGE